MKKRILSLILALSMVLSVFPLGAFAEGPLPELVMGAGGYPVCPDGTTGDGWEYKGGTLILKSGSYDFNYFYPKTNGGGVTEQTVHCGIKLEQDATITGGDFGANVTNDKGTISGGFFADGVTNSGTITGNGTFAGTVTNITGVTLPGGTISGGTFYGSVTNLNTIEKGTFEGNVTNSGTISGGTFAANKKVENYSYIENGTFEGSVTNYSYIENGTFNGTVTNEGANATIKNGTFEQEVINNNRGEISGGAFNKKVSNINGKIANGIFMGDVTNYSDGHILRGTFAGKVTNYGTIENGTFNGEVTNKGTIKDGVFKGVVENNDNGTISDGTFAGSVSNSGGTVNGGIFNGNTGLDGVTNLHSITVASGAKIEKVNDVSANWAPYVVIESGKTKEVTIKADTEIFSLNGRLLGEGDHVNGNNKIVKFTMPEANVVLNGAITCTDLVMENGYPKASKEGKISCSGTGWEYIKKSSGSTNTGTLYLMSGSEPFDFNFADPTTKITRTDAAVKCAIESYATISGGIFDGTVTNNAGGEISDGTFKGDVENSGYIEKGTFNGEVTNNTSGTIFGGTFRGQVDNNGKITGGIFAAGLSTTPGTVTGGAFNGKTGLTTKAHQVTVTNGSVSQVNGVDPRNADGTTGTAWDLYAYKGTTVIITADTEIFSLNGYPISGAYNSSYPYTNNKKIVKFTMPYNENVVLSTGELVMAGGYPIGSNNGANNYNGKGWAYSAGNLSDPTDTGTLHLWSGTFDFNFADPTTKITRTDSAVACEIQSYATIIGGIFAGSVKNGYTIENGTFTNKVENSGYINNGTFAGNVTNSGAVNGGVFNSNATLINVTGGHNITWDAAYSNAKIEKVNGVSADWAPCVVVTELTKTKEVIITADTEIFSLNHESIGDGNCKSSYGSDKTVVKFTMPDGPVVLNGAITCTDLVMKDGWPKDSSGGKTPCKGDGWEYIPNDPTNGNMLLLTGSNQTGGLFDFSTIGDGSAVECNVFVGKPTAITGGEFNGKVFNNSGILGGTFHGEVDNMGPGRIVNGTFKNSVENNGMIENGTFHDKVKNNGTIEKGTFEGTVENNTNGTISGGTFAGSVSNNGGTVNGGIFNGNTGLDGVTDLHSITWDAASSNAKIEKVNGVSADWAPYVVTSNATTKEVTITADTEIFSLNGQPIAESSYGVDKKTVTFTMPDDDVVLNGELITKPEPEPEPEPKPEPTPKPEPEPEPTTYTVTVIGGTIDGKTSVSAKENDTLTVVLDQSEIPDGMTFDMWSISSSKLSGDINVDYRAEAMTFQMPPEDVTIRAQYRSAEIIEDAAPSPLATAATIAVGGAAAGIVVWQGVNLGVDLYLANALPQGVPVPTDRRALALLLWETAGKPEVALPTLYGDIPAEEIELQKATRWAVQNGLMDAADKKDASFFDPDHYVTKMDVFGAWLRLKKLLGTT